MAELPRDPFAGVVTYLQGHELCPRVVRDKLVADVAGVIGLDFQILPNQTKEDGEVIDAISGISSPEQEDRVPDSIPLRTTAAITKEDQVRPAVLVARLPGGREEPEVLVGRLENLHDTVQDLTGRVN